LYRLAIREGNPLMAKTEQRGVTMKGMAETPRRVAVAGSERTAMAGAREIGTPAPDERIQISIIVRPKKPLPESTEALQAVNPQLRQYMSRDEFEREYGAHPADVKKVEAFAGQHNLTVVQSSLARRTVVLAGTISQLCEAFGVKLSTFEDEGRTFRGRSGPVYVPENLSEIVQGVFGFDNRRQARTRFRCRSVGSRYIARQGEGGYQPTQVAALYDFPAGTDGSGECIGIIEFGGGYTASDLQSYFSQIGVPEPSVTAVSVDGVQNQPSPGSNSPDTEVDLDIELSGSVAPGASIVVYFSDFTEQGWVDAITTAVHDSLHNPSAISISWGYAEGQDIWTSQAMQAVNDAFQSAATMGITVCVASGDDGSSDDVNDGLAHVDFPASSPYVLACGGTSLVSSGDVITSEVVWNDGPSGGASGGGVSSVFPLPSWQSQAKVPPSVNPGNYVGRGVPDVAGDADPDTGYQVLSDGQNYVVGGTSAVAPLWAGLIARINQKLGKPVGYLNPLIYPPAVSSDDAFHDITSGNNDLENVGGYSATKGWDACTGWGSPDGSGLLTALQASSAAADPVTAGRTRRKKAGGKRRQF
jgi:kumamolisin